MEFVWQLEVLQFAGAALAFVFAVFGLIIVFACVDDLFCNMKDIYYFSEKESIFIKDSNPRKLNIQALWRHLKTITKTILYIIVYAIGTAYIWDLFFHYVQMKI